MQSDQSKKVQYWTYYTLDLIVLHFNRKATIFEFRGAKK